MSQYMIHIYPLLSTESGVREFCEWESMELTCEPNAVLIVHSARYGRMRLGRCVTQSYGNIGCKTDVTSEIEPLCSARRQCAIDVISLHDKRSCPPDFKSYLEVDYECREGAYERFWGIE